MTTQDRISNIIATAHAAGLRVEDRTDADGIRLIDVIWDVEDAWQHRKSCRRMIWIRTGDGVRTTAYDYDGMTCDEHVISLAAAEAAITE